MVDAAEPLKARFTALHGAPAKWVALPASMSELKNRAGCADVRFIVDYQVPLIFPPKTYSHIDGQSKYKTKLRYALEVAQLYELCCNVDQLVGAWLVDVLEPKRFSDQLSEIGSVLGEIESLQARAKLIEPSVMVTLEGEIQHLMLYLSKVDWSAIREAQNDTPFRINKRRGPKGNASGATARVVNGLIAKWEEVTKRDLTDVSEANAVQDFYFALCGFIRHDLRLMVALADGELTERRWESSRLVREIRSDLPNGVARRRSRLAIKAP